MTIDDLPDDEATGWEAIDAAFARLYPGQQPKHVGTLVRWSLGGPDPLDGLSARKRLEPRPHWHFVSYGLTELYRKEWDDPERSGFGFELTFRLACAPSDEDPPMWAFSLMQNLARYVFQSGNLLRDGDWMSANGPIARDTETLLRSLTFVADPEVPPIDTPNGRVAFIQMVGLTLDEETAAKTWQTRKLLEAMQPYMPLWVTDLARGSLLDQPDVERAVREGMARDGSSTGALFTETLRWSVRKSFLKAALHVVELGAGQIEELLLHLALRLPFGRELRMIGPDARIVFAPDEADALVEQEGALRVQLSSASLEALRSTLRPVAGHYQIPGLKGVAWEVRQTLIRDANGNLVETIG